MRVYAHNRGVFMYKKLLIISGIAVFVYSTVFCSAANAFKASRHAAVTIVDKSSGIWPAAEIDTNLSKTFKLSDRGTNQNITGQYVVSGSKANNVQITLDDLQSTSPVTFKSMQVKRNSTNESVILATVVAVPSGVQEGRYSPAMQISANYE